MILSRSPLRITLGGGGTDLPSFYEKHGGLVVSMAIDKYIYVTYKPDDFEKLTKLRYSQIEIVEDSKYIKNTRAREALLYHNINNGCEINTCADLPSNTGLGSSGSFLVGMLHCIRKFKKLNTQADALAEEACKIEIDILQEPVGKQDQYISAHGGIKILDINREGIVSTKPLELSNQLTNEFISHICVYYLNVKRDASDILSEQQKLKGNSEETLKIIKEHGYKTINYLSNGNFEEYGKLMDEYWELKKSLSNKISIKEVDVIYDHVKKHYGVIGGKIIGAGGGGFLLLYCMDNRNKLDEFMKSKNYSRLNFGLDKIGSTILGNFIN